MPRRFWWNMPVMPTLRASLESFAQSVATNLGKAIVDELIARLREASAGELADLLGGGKADHGKSDPSKDTRAPKKTAKTTPAKKTTSKGGRPKSGTSKAGEARQAILDYIRANPGVKAEVARAALKLPKERWSAAAKALVETGAIKKKGTRRAATYTAVG